MGHGDNASRTVYLCTTEGKEPAWQSGRFTHKHWVGNRPSFCSQILYRWWQSGSWPKRFVQNYENTYNNLLATHDCAMSEVIKCQSPNTEECLRSQKSPCGIRVGHSVSGTSCLRVLYFPALDKWQNDNYIPPIHHIRFYTIDCTILYHVFAN
jgi:hypothetical protein